MKIYLQDCNTLAFIRCDSSWSPDINEALDFISVRRATLSGLRELKDAFQLLQAGTDGIQFSAPAVIPPLPAIKMLTVPAWSGPAAQLGVSVKSYGESSRGKPGSHPARVCW